MLKYLLPAILFITSCFAGEDLGAIEKSVTPVVRKYFPDAQIKVEGDSYVAKRETMEFQVHSRYKSGEIDPKAHAEEGPNEKGFLLQVMRVKGPYEGAAMVPQSLSEPYWTTYVNAVPTADGSGHWHILLSYGVELDQSFRSELMKALPRKAQGAGAPSPR